jgi:4-hydroxymandelate oxidase
VATDTGARVAPRTIDDYERLAQETLPPEMWGTIFGRYGAAGWDTNTYNIDAFTNAYLRPRVMSDVSARDTTTEVLGTTLAVPAIVAPTGHNQQFHVDGEIATANGAAAAGSLMIVSQSSSFSIEEVCDASAGTTWFQITFMRSRELMLHLVRRAEAAGCAAIVVTVDKPGSGPAPEAPEHMLVKNAAVESTQGTLLEPERMMRVFRDLTIDGLENLTRGTLGSWYDDAPGWEYLDWLVDQTSLPIVIKGVQTGDDARLSREHGAAAVVVSNHGGNGLRHTRGTLDVLPEVVEVAGDMEVYVDGGVRSGMDLLKATALGARAVLVGRIPLWGLAVNGPEGVADTFEILRRELLETMAYCGVGHVRSATPDLVDTHS